MATKLRHARRIPNSNRRKSREGKISSRISPTHIGVGRFVRLSARLLQKAPSRRSSWEDCPSRQTRNRRRPALAEPRDERATRCCLVVHATNPSLLSSRTTRRLSSRPLPLAWAILSALKHRLIADARNPVGRIDRSPLRPISEPGLSIGIGHSNLGKSARCCVESPASSAYRSYYRQLFAGTTVSLNWRVVVRCQYS